jgi:hypothetical protein
MMAAAARPGVSRMTTSAEPKVQTREAAAPRTTVLGESMEARVIPYASRTANEHIPFGVTAEQWAGFSPKERWKLNDGMFRMRINAGDNLVSTGRDPERKATTRSKFDLFGSEMLRANDRNVRVNQVPETVISSTIRNPVNSEKTEK